MTHTAIFAANIRRRAMPTTPAGVVAALATLVAPIAHASEGGPGDWLPVIVLGGIALFVAGVLVRMLFAARFPRGYRQWAEQRRDKFEARNEAWDRDDDERER
jgi:hypothetical protein